MNNRIDQVEDRSELPPRREPYWDRLSEGRHLGFRRMTSDSEGTWLARAYDGEGYVYSTLDGIDQLPDKKRYDAAKVKAEAWFKHLDMGGSTEAHTVKAACVAYVEKTREEKGEQAALNTEGFFNRLVYSDPLAKILLSKLSKTDCGKWRKRVLEHTGNSKSSFNRNITPLRAALNLAHEDGLVATDQAWLKALKPFKKNEGGKGKPRSLVLDGEQRRKFIACASAETQPFLKTLNMLPLRPGEVAAIRVDGFKAGQHTLEVTGKTGARIIPITSECVSHFKACAKGKLPAAWLVSRADGSQWKKEAWRDEVKAAARKAKLPRATVAYTLRHSVITDLIVGGLDVFTIAKLAGTSIQMIQEHYGHLLSKHAVTHLEKLATA